MKKQVWLNFILKEWLLIIAVTGLAITSFYAGKVPSFSVAEWQVLLMLYALFIAVKGLESNGLFSWVAWRIEQGKAIPLKLVLATFFLSMVVTNDVALIIIVPVTLAISIRQKDWVVILETLAANAGSALTPIGNPQNLFLYWHYHVSFGQFISVIFPLTLLYLGVLICLSALVKQSCSNEGLPNPGGPGHLAVLFSCLLFLMVLVVLHVLPVMAGVLVIALAVMFDRRALLVDYALLMTFFCFFGIAQNFQQVHFPRIEEPHRVFLLSAFSSQVISNVPAAILFAKFTTQWKALLWGTNVGGFGSIVGSLANLIAYRFYVVNKGKKDIIRFTIKFLTVGYVAFLLSVMIFLRFY